MTLYYILDHFARLILVTCVLQLGSVLLHFVLRASVSDRHDHPGDIPPHSIFNRKGLLIGVLESHSCSTETNCVRKTTSPLADCLCHCVMWCETEPVLVQSHQHVHKKNILYGGMWRMDGGLRSEALSAGGSAADTSPSG